MTRLVAMTFWGKERFLEAPAGGEADEAHAHAFDEGLKPHDALMESAGDRPRHEPGEHVGPVDDRQAAHGGGHAQGHGVHVPHESPPSMWVPLAVLALLAVVGGFVGISPAFSGGKHVGGRLNIVTWLEPVVWNPATHRFGEEPSEEAVKAEGSTTAPLPTTSEPTAPHAPESAGAKKEAAPYSNTGFNLAHAVEERLGSHSYAEWFFIIVSLVVAGVGITLGLLFYVWRPRLPAVWAARLGPLYRASYHKYWVDELYGALFTRRTMDAARAVYAVDSKGIDGAVNGSAWLTRMTSLITGGFDKYVVDGLVNTIAGFISRLMSPLIRATQTGFTQNYALVMVIGLIAAVALFFGGDIWTALRGLRQ
jgi:NADH-quinone oxidoreductase subunit L